MPIREIWKRYWPLAASWLLMGVELPAVTAVMARFTDPEVNLAAYGGVVFPLCLLIEAPVIMLLATSTSLARDRGSYLMLRRFTNGLAAALTLLHILVAFTPLWDLVATELLGAPEAILEPGRTGMQIMLPWTWAIAIRRFQQGVLIRFGHSRAIGVGTVVRLASGASVLLFGLTLSSASGIVVGASATATAVVAEAIYVALRIRPVLRDDLDRQPPIQTPLTLRALIGFHTPLALTSALHLLSMPIASAAMGRMPLSLASLAAWPVVHGFIFLFRALGLAYTEVVVVLAERDDARPTLRRFALLLGASTSLLLLPFAASSLGHVWLIGVAGLTVELAQLAQRALWIAVALPFVGVLQSLYQGTLVSEKRTREVSNAVVLGLLATVLTLAVGIVLGSWTGLYVAIWANLLGNLAQVLWLRFRQSAH